MYCVYMYIEKKIQNHSDADTVDVDCILYSTISRTEQTALAIYIYMCPCVLYGRVNVVLCSGAVICKQLVTRDNENAFETYGRLKHLYLYCRCRYRCGNRNVVYFFR